LEWEEERVNQDPEINNLFGPTDFGCGGFEWLVEFKLPEPASQPGYIVQQISRNSNIQTFDGTKVAVPDVIYWEAWPVRRGDRLTSTRFASTDDGRQYDDSYDHDRFPQTHGVITLLGVAKFYEEKLTSDFKKNNPLTEARSLYSTPRRPAFWDGTGTAHNLWLTWDCTAGKAVSSLLVQKGKELLQGAHPPPPELDTPVRFQAMEAYKVPADALFAFDRFVIAPGAEKALWLAVEYIKAFKGPDQKVEITGYTDSIGDKEYNKKLSWNRADAVAKWLISHKILEAKDVMTIGAGATRPLVPNTRPNGSDDPAGRARNRRVEIIVRT
jgi:outer membrane protein OmpA-like peptidoglycan-associated protein